MGKKETADLEDQCMFNIEYKYCTLCNLEQPLRTKHCKKCDNCVSTYDHHCFWLGNCVGERNRPVFFFFLLFQFIQLIIGLFIFLEEVLLFKKNKSAAWQMTMAIVSTLICAFFIYFVGTLLYAQVYCASNNITQWEFIKWDKVTYMKVYPKKLGSPFSLGSRKANLKLFFFGKFHRTTHAYRWTYPKTLPDVRK